MNLERINHWVGLLANVGVFVGFVLVAYQLHLNTQGLQASSIETTHDILSNAEMALMGDTGYDAYAKSILNPADLSPGELMQVWTYQSMAYIAAFQSFIDFREGRVSEETWINQREVFISHFNYPLGRIWWEEAQSASEPETVVFFESVNESLRTQPPNQTSTWFTNMLKRAQGLRADTDV